MTVTKYHGIKSLAEIYAKRHNTTLKLAEERVKEMVELLELGLLDTEYDGIQFIDSITFRKVLRKAKIGRNPRTKQEVLIPDRIGIKTDLGKNFANKLEIK